VLADSPVEVNVCGAAGKEMMHAGPPEWVLPSLAVT
jgi:hypothetical protein